MRARKRQKKKEEEEGAFVVLCHSVWGGEHNCSHSIRSINPFKAQREKIWVSHTLVRISKGEKAGCTLEESSFLP